MNPDVKHRNVACKLQWLHHIASYLAIEAYSFIEYFAGTASCSRAIRSAGHHTASLDILYWDTKPGKQNVMDILTPSGMGFLGHFFAHHVF